MLGQEMLAFTNHLTEQGIVFCYSGVITEKQLTAIGNVVKNKLELENTETNIARSVFSVFVEQVQNVIRYSVEKLADEQDRDRPADANGYGLIIVGQKDGKHFITCGNLIEIAEVERLRAALTYLQSLNAQELKALYKQTLRAEVPATSKGAGVGFIDIARRAINGFEFDFTEKDARYAYFAVKAYI